MPNPLSDRGARIQAFQLLVDALPFGGTKLPIGVLRPDVGQQTLRNRGMIEFRRDLHRWEAMGWGGGFVGHFQQAGEAINALWELDPWDIRTVDVA